MTDELEKLNAKVDSASSDIHWMKIALSEWNEATKNGEEVMAIMERLGKDDEKQAHVILFIHFINVLFCIANTFGKFFYCL